MTPETKKWLDEVKKRCSDYQPNSMLKHAWDDLPKAIQIIEEQEKEIDRLKVALQQIRRGKMPEDKGSLEITAYRMNGIASRALEAK